MRSTKAEQDFFSIVFGDVHRCRRWKPIALGEVLQRAFILPGRAFCKFTAMEIGLTPQERSTVRLARRKHLCPQGRPIWVMPWWAVALLALVLLLPSHGLSLLLVPLCAWQRHHTRQRIAAWALDLRQL